MTSKTITILGEKFEITAPYAEGQTLTAVEARVLNQTRAENIGNNLRKVVKEAQEKNDLSGVAEKVAAFDAEYTFSMPGQSAPRIVDPVEREALKLAREYVGNKLKAAYGISLKGIHPNFKDQPEEDAKAASAELFASAIEKAAQDATILALAKKNVQAKQKATESATVDLGI